MKFFNLIYASIYDWYNRMKTNGRNVNPSGMVALMFGLAIEGWGLLSFYLFYKYFKNNASIPSTAIVVLFVLAIVFASVVNEYYTSKNRHLNVYNDYISVSSKEAKAKNILVSFCVLLFPYIILLLAFIF
ncbi:MAG: hypothetical protein JSR13_13230 [Proteobacteria bacterium]|nr:hypothetical protein [Pseudomonadota bacterium]MBS1758173.1 hypothetical protein [Bacteroidota bacterium]